MKTYKNIAIAIFSTLALNISSVNAEADLTGKIKYEGAFYTNTGKSFDGVSTHGKDFMKNQLEANFFVDNELSDISSIHAEVHLTADSKAVDGYSEFKSYTQKDILRELYVDTEYKNWILRLGKQQVVWGTADGIKLLDLINPTDFSEFNQNSPEDSRIPVWMINAEKEWDSGANFQIILSQPRENIFAGINRGIDTSVRTNEAANFRGIADKVIKGTNQGHPFILKGVDTITGQKNGFLNIAPDLGSVAAGFAAGFVPLFDPFTRAPIAQGNLSGLNNLDPRFDSPSLGIIGGKTAKDRYNSILSNFTVGAFTSGANLSQLDSAFRQMQLDNNLARDSDSDGTPDLGGTMGFANTYFGLNIANNACKNTGFNPGFNPGVSPGSNANCQNLFSQFDNSGKITGSQTIVAQSVSNIFGLVSTGNTGISVLDDFGAQYDSNLSSFADGERNSAFEYMKKASFRTFDTFTNAKSQYIFDMPKDADANLAFRFKDSLENGLNYSLNYSYNYDANPVINLSWRNSAGEVLKKTVTDDITATLRTPLGVAFVGTGTYISLADSQGRNYGGSYNRSAILTFEQTLERAHNIGGSFDYAIDTDSLGAIVLRVEALYQKDVYSPIIDLDKLSIGDLTDALKMTAGDKFRYVVGVDITVLTNMLVSTQFIQEKNLDFIDSGNKYTADFASMHLTNGLLKAQKNKNFISVYLSKPFGSSGEHRWNNIIIKEDQGSGAYWNRLDVEYSLNDDVVLTAEWNRYWGEKNSQFGQVSESSNIQIGFNYSF